jgi:tetratricopeptide (TPR) repeat protein
LRYLCLVAGILEILCVGSIADVSGSSDTTAPVSCISEYRNGYYARAISCFENALSGLSTRKDSVDAFGMLAQSYGMINQIENAKAYFGLMLDKDPYAEIDTLAFPPNIAIIFNQVKLEKKVSQIESSTVSKPLRLERKKNPGIPLLLSSVVLSTGGAAFLYTRGIAAYNDYSKIRNDQDLMDAKWREYTLSVAGGVACTIVSGITTIFFIREINKDNRVSFSGMGNGILMSYRF